MSREAKYGKTIKPWLKRMYELERERKALNKEWREITQKIRGLNTYLLTEGDE